MNRAKLGGSCHLRFRLMSMALVRKRRVKTGARHRKGDRMGAVRVLVGTRKGAFILTSDGTRDQWDIKGPLFGGWEIYHLNGSAADPKRLYASQSSGWFGQQIQRSDDGGQTWEPVGNTFV